MRRAKKHKNSSSARHYDQIRFRFHTAWVIRDRAISLETQPMTAVASKRTSAERRPGSPFEVEKSLAQQLGEVRRHARLLSCESRSVSERMRRPVKQLKLSR